MKAKITIFTLFALFIAVNVQAKIKIIRSGSTDGVHYDRVSETNGWFNHTLRCSKPGAITCGFASVVTVTGTDGAQISVDEIVKTIDANISKGDESGTLMYDGIRVMWKANNKNSQIVIYEAGETPQAGDLE